jgi:hypothetical protein
MTTEDTRRQRRKRLAQRYPLSLKVVLASGEGVTRDISAQGIYIACTGDMTTDDAIDFVVEFGAGEAEGRVKLRCKGKIVRVERGEWGTGIAAKIVSSAIELQD